MTETDSTAPRKCLERIEMVMVRSEFKKVETPDLRPLIGRAIQRAFSLAGWSQKEAAGQLERSEAQISRWIAGTERPQLDVLFGCEALRWPLIQALAALDSANEVTTHIRRRSA